MRSASRGRGSRPTPTAPPSCRRKARTPRSGSGRNAIWRGPSAIAWATSYEGTAEGTAIIRPIVGRRYLFTSESVTEGHPDKLADQISDAVLDAVLTDDPLGRVACETLVTTGVVFVGGEITTETYVDVANIVRDTIRRIGYIDSDFGFDANTCGVVVAIDPQSP